MKTSIATLDFVDYRRGYTASFTGAVTRSLQETGFFLLSNHGISETLLRENRRLFAIFFKDLTPEERMRYAFPSRSYQRGYTPMKIETGEFAKVPDHKHFFQFGDIETMPYVKEIPDLQAVSEELYAQFGTLYKDLMKVVAVSLGLDKEYFTAELGNSIIRHIHYPPHSAPVFRDEAVEQGGNIAGMCAARHTDINDLTLLHATEPGLELWHNGEWIPVLCDFDKIIINAGDMLWHLTGGRYKSGQHRVVCQPGVERFSSPFFGHRKDPSSIVPLANLGESDLTKFHFTTEGEFLAHRLKQIGLKN